MKLSRIRLEQFKQFRQPLEISGLGDGLNLFSGPNEAGKSTIVAAVRAAFFERHRSGSVDELRPWGDASASPTVELDFSIAGKPYHLSKRFLGKKRCELLAGAERYDGAAAEDHLAELLGFQHALKGESAAKHWGIPGLLWIQQGAGHDIREPVAHATDHLRHALNESLGEVASSSGDDVLAQVENLRNELLTPAGGAPRGAHAEAQRRQAQLASELRALDADIAAYAQQVDRLAGVRAEHAADVAAQPWAGFRMQEAEARARLEAVDRIQAALATDRQRAGQLDTQIDLLRAQLAAFASEEAAVSLRAAAFDNARRSLQAGGPAVEQWARECTAAVAACDAARETLRQVRLEQTRRSLARELDELTRKAAASGARLNEAAAEQARLLDLRAQAAASAIDAGVLQQLRDHTQQRRELQVQRDAVATRVRFTLHDAADIQLGDDRLTGSGERLLLAPTRLQLGAVGHMEILPGGADLAELGRQQSAVSDALAALLQQHGLVSVDAAERRQQLQLQGEAELKTALATLKVLAPKGIDVLREEAQAQAVRRAEVEAALAGLPTGAGGALLLPSSSEAEALEEGSRRSLDQINTSLNQARLSAAHAQSAVDAAEREHQAAAALLQGPDRAPKLLAANQALIDARAEQAALAETVKAKASEVAQARPDLLAQDIARFQQSADQLAKAHEERKTTLLRLEVALESAGAHGLEERRGGIAADLTQAQRRADELQRRANALDHLLGLLKRKRGELTRKLQAPLQNHLNHYLQILFPGAQLAIDENLSPGPLTRSGPAGPESGAFDALSFGAREQMGLISRLAYADLLREAGRPTLIILDDALVHSDEVRLAQMKRILFDAATRHQVLLFTCHPAQWRDMGTAVRSLASLMAPSGETA